MGLTYLNCDTSGSSTFPSNLSTDICSVTAVKWEVTGFASVALLAVGLYLMHKWKFRCHKTLLTFHNLRAAVALLLLAINSLELARAFLPWPPAANVATNGLQQQQQQQQYHNSGRGNGHGYGSGSERNFSNPAIAYSIQQQQQYRHHFHQQQMPSDHVLVIIGMSGIWNGIAAMLFTIMLMWYHRIVELKKTAEFLYVSSSMAILIFIFRIYELAEIVYDEYIFELEPCLQAVSATCLLSLGITDGFTVYKERYRPDYLEDYEKIGYKHTLATFYSKTCFWWLTPLLWFGYKEPLELEDLGQMRVEDSARAHYDRFLLIYQKAKVKNADRPPSLWLCYAKSSWRMFTLGGVLKLCGDLFALIGPLAIQQIVQYIEAMYALHYGALPQVSSNYNNNSSNSASNNNNSSITRRGLRNPYDNNSNSSSMSSIIPISIRATGSIWLPNPDDNDAHNQIANGVDYNSAEVKIYYPSWLDLVSNGWAIAWLVLLAALAQAALSQASTHILNMTGIRIKTSLQGLIYRKTLLLNSSCIDVDCSASGAGWGEKAAAGDNGINENNCQKEHNDPQQRSGSSSRQEHENGLNDVGAITNLMSEDTLNIMSFFWIAHYVWAIPLKIAVVMYLLYLKLGISAVIGSFVCILTMTPLQFLIGKAMSTNTETMAKHTDERLKKIHDTFVGIKLIKLNAWDDVFLKKICAAREKELKYLNKDSLYWTLMTVLTHMSSVLITFVTLAVYVHIEGDGSNQFRASHLFSALALFQQLTVPLLIFPITVPIIISAVVSTKRLERFLYAREIQKHFEGIRHMARILSKSDASLDMYEVRKKTSILAETNNVKLVERPPNEGQELADDKEKDKQVQKENKLNERLALRIHIPDKPAPLAQSEPQTPLEVATTVSSNRSSLEDKFTKYVNESLVNCYEGPDKRLSLQRKELLRNTPYVVIRPRTSKNFAHLMHSKKSDSWHRDSLLLKMPVDMAVSVKECSFAWNPQRLDNMLTIKDVAIPRGRLTIIVGKNGSGKTSFLSALLMEMPLISGDMIWNKTSTIAFVPQQPWLLNASIRENILFGEFFRPKRYDYVLDACALKPDIELMPEADFTVIGERGINLSGGQRQRVAIARALYSSANVVIMDDPLSSLDNEVGRHIFEQSIKKMLLKANRTVILVTQQLHLVQQAHYLIVMKDGRLQASGSYKDIEMKHPHIIVKWNTIIAKATERDLNNLSALGRTARERWKLFKNVTKMGLQRSASVMAATSAAYQLGRGGVDNVDDVEAEMAARNAENDDVLPASLHSAHPLRGTQSLGNFTLTRKRSSVYGSRHLIYDVPLPIDECQTEDVIMRRRRRGTTISANASTHTQQQQQRPNSRASSRLSGISINSNSTELRRSLLTASCSSATSYASNNSSNASTTDAGEAVGQPTPRVQSWQPQSAVAIAKLQHQPVARNISSPGSFQHTITTPAQPLSADAALVADLVKSTKPDGGFQQFLRRMSMRRSNKPSTVAVHRMHRPVSATNSILSISEEATSTTTPTPTTTGTAIGTNSTIASSLPSIELSSAATDTETESWLANIENEEPVYDANIDYKALTNNANATAEVGPPTGASSPAGPSPSIAAESEPEPAEDLEAITTTTSAAAAADGGERKYGKIPAQIYLLYLRASGLPIVLIFFATALIWQGLRVYTDVWLQHWTDDNGAATTTTGTASISATSTANAIVAQHEVTYYFHVYAAISCVCIVMAMISTPAGQLAGCNARRNLHDKLLQTIMRKSLHFFQVTPLGRLMNRFSNDMAIIDKKIAATSQRLLQFTLLCLCAILINVSITPWFILLTLPICVAYYAIQKFYRCSSRELQRIENSTNSPVISHLSETIQGVTTIRAYNQEARFTEILFRRLEANTIAFTILNTSNRWLGISLDYLGGVIVFVAIVTALLAATISCRRNSNDEVGSYDGNNNNKNNMATEAHNSPSPSLVGLAINYTLLVPIYLNWVVKLLADMEMYVGSVERISYYAETDMEAEKEITNDDDDDDDDDGDDDSAADDVGGGSSAVDDKLNDATVVNDDDDDAPRSKQVKKAEGKEKVLAAVMERNDVERRASVRRLSNGKRYKTVPISWPQRGDISFENVSLRYEGQSEDVIKNLTLHIPAGQRIGICGRTGSGKSSLALSLFGVLRTTSGRIRIDDVDITQIHSDEIRTRLSIIPQDVHLFSATIRENLDPPGYYSDLALWNCLELAQLKEFVNGQMPQGLDTEITEGGLNLSAGHRQLFCLARAILRGSVCLVLDEATSSLDSSTEKSLLSAAHKAFKGRTILTIAHRLSTILDYDRIIVFENGKIAEDGSPQELQRKSDGVFNSLLHSGRPLSLLSDAGAGAQQDFLAGK